MQLPGASGHPSAMSGCAKGVAEMMNSEVRASGHYLAQRPVAAADVCYCQVADRMRPVLIGLRPTTSVELVSSRSCVRLGSYLRAWTLLDILGLLLCF